jgi:hypothetical protein
MSSCGSESYGSLVVREAHNWACLVRAADEARNGHTGAAVDGPGSLLNYQGHPLDRLTPDRDVTNPSTDAKENGSHHNPGRNALPPSPSALSAGVYVDDLLSDDPDRCVGVLPLLHHQLKGAHGVHRKLVHEDAFAWPMKSRLAKADSNSCRLLTAIITPAAWVASMAPITSPSASTAYGSVLKRLS